MYLLSFSAPNAAQIFLKLLEERGVEATIKNNEIWVKHAKDLKDVLRLQAEFEGEKPAIIHSGGEEIPPRPEVEDPSLPKYKSRFMAKKTPITFLILILCSLIYFVSSFQATEVFKEEGQVALEVGQTPIMRALLFDFPKQNEDLLKAAKNYPLNTLGHISQLQGSARDAYESALAEPKWAGIYTYIVDRTPWDKLRAIPVFEKIEQGEIWRVFTPSLLHGGFLHLLFNMMWLLSIGRLIEGNLGSQRFALLILFFASLANLAQYLVSGAFFLGFSGAVCGMIGFVFTREKIAPWERYAMPFAAFKLVLIFIGVMTLIQLIAFIAEFFHIGAFSPGIANTSHLVGLAAGMACARLPFFAEESR